MYFGHAAGCAVPGTQHSGCSERDTKAGKVLAAGAALQRPQQSRGHCSAAQRSDHRHEGGASTTGLQVFGAAAGVGLSLMHMVCLLLQILEALFEQRDLTEQETSLAIEVSLGLDPQV